MGLEYRKTWFHSPASSLSGCLTMTLCKPLTTPSRPQGAVVRIQRGLSYKEVPEVGNTPSTQ